MLKTYSCLFELQLQLGVMYFIWQDCTMLTGHQGDSYWNSLSMVQRSSEKPFWKQNRVRLEVGWRGCPLVGGEPAHQKGSTFCHIVQGSPGLYCAQCHQSNTQLVDMVLNQLSKGTSLGDCALGGKRSLHLKWSFSPIHRRPIL